MTLTMPGGRRVGRETILSVSLLGVIAGLAWAAAWAMDNASYEVVAGTLIGILLAVASLVAGRAIARREPDPGIARLLRVAPLLKLSVTIARYAVAFALYDGQADSAGYDLAGIELRASYAEGILNPDLGTAFVGTGFIRVLTGLLYTVTGPSLLGAFFVFSWVGFWGLYLFYRAFCTAVPEGDRHRYARLVLLLPSLLFWPSGLGKEAIITLGLGAVAYGAARVLTKQPRGFVILAAGLLLTGAVRPHVAGMAAAALMAAYLTRRQPAGVSIVAPVGKLVGLVVLGVALVVTVGQTQSLLGIDDFNAEAVEEARSSVIERTDQGGSAFDNEETDLQPSKFHLAVVSVLFRPFPWEAGNVQSFLAALEGLVLLGLFVLGWRRLLGGLRSMVRTPYVMLCVTYSVLFIYGFSSFTNFGILTRQRVQVLPFVVVLVCLPPLRRGPRALHDLLVATPGRARPPN